MEAAEVGGDERAVRGGGGRRGGQRPGLPPRLRPQLFEISAQRPLRTAAIAAYPQLGVSGKPVAVSNEWGVNTNLFNADETTMRFLEDVLGQMAKLFPGRYVHVGGDEAVKDQWKASARMQARIRALGAKDEAGLQAWMVARLERYLSAHGKRLLGNFLDGRR